MSTLVPELSSVTGDWCWQEHDGHGWIRAERDGKAYNAADDVSEEDGRLICEAVNTLRRQAKDRE